MSQVIKNLASGPVPPYVATSYVTDVNSPSVPIANVENVLGGTTSINNNKGIQTDGSSGSNTLTVQLTNRFQNSVTTNNATPTTISTFPMGAVPGVYTFDINIAAFDTTDTLGTGFSVFTSVRTTGAAGTICGSPDIIANPESATIQPATVTVSVSGNNFLIQVVGIAATTIDWNSITNYVFVS